MKKSQKEQKLAEEIFISLVVKQIEASDNVVQVIGELTDNMRKKAEEKYGTKNIYFFTTTQDPWNCVWVNDAVVIDSVMALNGDKVDFLEGEKLQEFYEFSKNNFHLYETAMDVYTAFLNQQIQ